jgi:uncharacterized protein (DUF4415 family)
MLEMLEFEWDPAKAISHLRGKPMTAKPRSTTKFRLDPDHQPELTPAQAERLKAIPIDYSDIPELPDDFWVGNPPTTREPKKQITLRVDSDVVEFFRARGDHYQSRINAVLRSYVDHATRKRVAAPAKSRDQGVLRHAAKASKPSKGGQGHK